MSDLETLSTQEKKQRAFERMSRFDAAALVVNTAIEVRDGGHDITVRHARVLGQPGILVFIPNFELVDGNLRLVSTEPVAASI